jgi:chemotaxis protein MotB
MSGQGDPSGMIVYPKMPVPQQRQSEPRLSPGGGGKIRPQWDWKWIGGVLVALAIGAGVMFFVKPSSERELAVAHRELAAAQKAASVEKDRADGLDQRLAVLGKEKDAALAKLSEVSAQAADAEKKAAEATAAAEKKLQATIDKSQGSVTTEGDAIHLKLVDKVLFAVGDDQLTDKGKTVLAKVGKALADLPDKQIWVQGHTDDTPIAQPGAKKGGKKKGGKPVEAPRFASNWELSAARALQVVHYLQDTANIDPTRLAALAFGEYRPVSKTTKALNRRIEIVLYPSKAILERGATPAKK